MEEVGLREVAHDAGNMLRYVESSVHMARREFGIGCPAVGIAEQSTLVVIPHGVMVVGREMISKCVLWTHSPKTDIPLEMM